MKGVTRSDHDFNFIGSDEAGGRRFRRETVEDREVLTAHWKPSKKDLEALQAGGHVAVTIPFQPIPIHVAVEPEPEEE